jgi:hypothetical protein
MFKDNGHCPSKFKPLYIRLTTYQSVLVYLFLKRERVKTTSVARRVPRSIYIFLQQNILHNYIPAGAFEFKTQGTLRRSFH